MCTRHQVCYPSKQILVTISPNPIFIICTFILRHCEAHTHPRWFLFSLAMPSASGIVYIFVGFQRTKQMPPVYSSVPIPSVPRGTMSTYRHGHLTQPHPLTSLPHTSSPPHTHSHMHTHHHNYPHSMHSHTNSDLLIHPHPHTAHSHTYPPTDLHPLVYLTLIYLIYTLTSPYSLTHIPHSWPSCLHTPRPHTLTLSHTPTLS